ncbi:MAG: type IV pilus assembly protein PilM [Deltaproteobacteria bacterium]|nr:type IV pilus assembly protein PilM [Deltaproteobacteria bacterium]
MGIFASTKSVLGLDIGSHSIKALVLNQSKAGLQLEMVGMAQLPPSAIEDGEIREQGVVVSAIKNLLKALKISLKSVCTSISGNSVIIKKIKLPTTTREELVKNIEVEAEQFIPFDISEVNVDFQILGESGGGGGDQMDVILVAAKKDVIDAYMNLLVEAKLKPTVIDVDVFALENAFTHTHPELKDTVALIDIGANKMNINTIKEGMSLLTKDAAIGGARITGEIQDRLNVDYETAEAIKMGGVEPEDPQAVSEIIGRAVGNWVTEMRRTVDFMEASYPRERLKAIYLSGGSCRFPGLTGYLEKEFGVPSHLFNAFEKIGINPKRFDPTYIEYLGPQATICLGLALRRGEQI